MGKASSRRTPEERIEARKLRSHDGDARRIAAAVTADLNSGWEGYLGRGRGTSARLPAWLQTLAGRGKK